MKAIMVMFDSLNRHMLPPYGGDWVHAPNFQRLAEHSVTFDTCYIGSMPCIPARRELHTGRYNFLHRGWGPLEPFDDSMPEILKQHGIHTHLVTDHQHYWEDGGATYHNRYSSYEFVRGQEGDLWKGVVQARDTADNTTDPRDYLYRQDAVNRTYLRSEELMPQAVTFKLGLEFIQTNHDADNWFLQLEVFDPHEPFFTQEWWSGLYPDDYDGEPFDWPPYEPVTESEQLVAHVRSEYAALVTMCDHYLGKVLDAMDSYNMWDDTLLIVNTDHGYLLGEHGWWAKTRMPWYNELAHIPLFIWDPRSRKMNERRSSLVQTIDLPTTILEYFDISRPSDMQGQPLRQVIADDTPVRQYALFGMFAANVNITDGRYVYMRAAQDANVQLYNYTLMPMHMRQMFSPDELQSVELSESFTFTKNCRTMRIPSQPNPWEVTDFETMLFDLGNDPGQLLPIDDPEIEAQMIAQMIDLMRQNDAPAEQYERLGLATQQTT